MKKYKKLHESKEVANIHIAKIKARGGEVKQSIQNGKVLLEYSFDDAKNLSIEDMLRDKETLEIMKGLGDKNDIKNWIKRYHSKPINHKPNTYYRIERSSGAGYGGVGNGLYLGRDKQALSNFYDIEQEGLPISVYKGNPKWLDLMDYAKYRKFERDLLKKGIKMTNSDKVGKIVTDMGFDGIKYYDPQATGEEFVLFNLKSVRKV